MKLDLTQEFKVEVVHLNEEGHRMKTHVGLFDKQPTKKEITDLIEESMKAHKDLAKLKIQVHVSDYANVVKGK
mgnify:CR=1 FL=1